MAPSVVDIYSVMSAITWAQTTVCDHDDLPNWIDMTLHKNILLEFAFKFFSENDTYRPSARV